MPKQRTPEELEALLQYLQARIDRLEDAVNFLLRSRAGGPR